MQLRKFAKSVLSLLLLLSMVLGFIPLTVKTVSPVASAAEKQVAETQVSTVPGLMNKNWDVNGDGTLAILCIGNSFSVDAMEYVYQIANNLGVKSIHLGNLYIGGCALSTHWSNAKNDSAAYTYWQNTAGSWSSTASYKISTALSSRRWDYVSLQQASPNSGQADTYNSDLTNLISYVKARASGAKLIWHMTWAYQSGSQKLTDSVYSSQDAMYSAIVSAVQSKIVTNSDFAFVVPSGTAIQNARTSLIKDNLCRDGYHLNKNIGRYIAGLTFVKALGLDISTVNWRPRNVPDGYKAIAIESAENAVNKPYSKTTSAHTTPKGSAYYQELNVTFKFNHHWNSTSETYNAMIEGASTATSLYNKYYCINKRFVPKDLPIGTIFITDSAWQYRSDTWLADEQQDKDNRPGAVKSTHTVCSEEWWDTDGKTGNSDDKQFKYRSFNVSKRDSSVLTGNEDIKNLFEIYIPKEYATNSYASDYLYNEIPKLSAAVPNNYRLTFADAAAVHEEFTKSQEDFEAERYLIVHDTDTTLGGTVYVMDMSTPRADSTIHAASAQVKKNGSYYRVYGADPSWGISIAQKGEIFQNSGNHYKANFRFEFWTAQNKTGTYDGRYIAYHNKQFKFYKSTAFSAYGEDAIRPDIHFNVEDDNERFHFYSNSDIADSKTYRSEFVNNGNDEPFFKMGTTKKSAGESYAKFNVYKIETNKTNTEKLHAKLSEARSYLLMDHTYFETEFKTFLTAMSAAFRYCRDYNYVTDSDGSKQTTINTALTNLTNAINALNVYNEIESMDVPYNKEIAADSKLSTEGALNGTYFLTNYFIGNVDKVYNFTDITKTRVDTNTSVNSALDSFRNKRLSYNSSKGIVASDLTYAVTLRSVKGKTNGYTIQFEDRNFLHREGTSWAFSDLTSIESPNSIYYFINDPKNKTNLISIQNNNGSGVEYMIYYVADIADVKFSTWRHADKTSGTYTSASERYSHALFQFSTATLELYRALQFIQPYCRQNEAVKRYPREIYEAFLSDVDAAMSAYKTYNTSANFNSAAGQTVCEEWATKLRDWTKTLTMEDVSLDYIDIPIEILDFRADSFLFEWINSCTGYNLAGAGTSTTPEGSSNACYVGLTLEELVDGNLVYKPETVEYVANLFMNDPCTFDDHFGNANNSGAEWNEEIWKKLVGDILPAGVVGTKEDLIPKLTPNESGERIFGCDLAWNRIETAYDLAYYCLTYLWRAAGDGENYNMVVPERENMRLYREEGEAYYTIYSDNYVNYDGRYIYNAMPVMSVPSIASKPKFDPISGLGFETNGKETDAGTAFYNNGNVDALKDANYHYSIHASASFVYYEDQDQYFKFIGDDDVYFFVNNKLALDVGGAHSAATASLSLNSKAQELGLKDGEVFTFDMYYIERHSTGSNMMFQTNINIVDTDTFTTKGQYLEISGDTDMVDEATGMGADLLDNGLVKVGDTVAYSFDVVNSHDVSIYDVSFRDDTLGVMISKDVVNLGKEELSNAITQIEDIAVYYRTSSKSTNGQITVNNDVPMAKTVAEIKEMINAANTANETTSGNSIPTGSYRVTMTSEQDLMDLLALGVPANCQILVYGFKRLLVENDENTTITNELKMTCSYLPWGTIDTEENVRTLTGTARRIMKVAALSGIPSARKVEYVLDNGKPLEVAFNGLISEAQGVTVNGIVGFTASGYNGEFLKSAPADLRGDFETDSGIFTYNSYGINYTLTDMLDKTERVYAVVSLSGCEITDAQNKARNYPYILLEMVVVPATSIYYETEKLADVFQTTVKNGSDWETVNTYIEDIHDSYADNNYDEIAQGAEFFFDFTNRPEDRERYNSDPNYGGFNFDEGNWTSHYTVGSTGVFDTNYTIDNEAGTLSLMVGYGFNEDGDGYNEMYGPEIYTSAVAGRYQFANPPFVYNPPEDGLQRYVQVRFKTVNCAFDAYNSLQTKPVMILRYGVRLDEPNEEGYYYMDFAPNGSRVTFDLHNDEYITLTAPLTEDFAGEIGYLGVRFRNIIPADGTEGSVVIDYIYIGTEDGLPSLNEKQNAEYVHEDDAGLQDLFFGFNNSEKDRGRYSTQTYGTHNFDVGNWTTHYVSDSTYGSDYSIDNVAGTMTIAVRDGYSTYGSGDSQEIHYGTEVYTTAEPNKNNKANPALQFDPANAEYMYVRFKVDNCIFEPGTGTDDRPNLILRYTYWDEDSGTYKERTDIRYKFDLKDGEYIIAEVPLNDDFKNSAKIGYIGLRFRSLIQATDAGGTITLDYIRIGTKSDIVTLDSDIYGYDVSYRDDERLSNSQGLFVEGAGVPNLTMEKNSEGKLVYTGINYDSAPAYTEASFDFVGTGFDIIGRTGKEQGALRVVILNEQGGVEECVTVMCSGDSELYQIPIVSVEGLTHGNYSVHIFVNAPYKNDTFPDLNRGGEFYFDAVRIYNITDTASADAESAFVYSLYQAHGEADPNYTEVRQILIDAGNFRADGTMNGVVYLDATAKDDAEFDDEDGRLDAVVAEYKAIGPNNEVYLASGNAIAFKLVVDGELPASIDIGAKSVDGLAVLNTVAAADINEATTHARVISTMTSLYYPIGVSAWVTDAQTGENYTYVVVKNSGNGVLSITDIKLAYSMSTAPADEKSCAFIVDRDLMQMVSMADVAVEPETSDSVFDKNLKVDMSISVGAEMQVMYTVLNARVKDYESFYVEVVKVVVGGESVKTVFSLDNGNMDEIFAPNGNLVGYSATYTGIFAMEMGDNFTATLYAVEEDGTIYYGDSESASIKTYLMEKLADSTSSDELKTLAVDMLNYGAAAQVNFNYDAENLVNADLTDEQKLLGTQEIPSATDSSVTSGDGGRTTTSVSLQSKVLLYVNCNYAKTENSNLEFVVKNLNGDVLERFAPTVAMAKLCQGVYGNVGARQMRDLITIELYDNGKLVSQTLTWNIESYVAQTRANSASSEALIATVNAMLAYGDSAAVYLTASGQ